MTWNARYDTDIAIGNQLSQPSVLLGPVRMANRLESRTRPSAHRTVCQRVSVSQRRYPTSEIECHREIVYDAGDLADASGGSGQRREGIPGGYETRRVISPMLLAILFNRFLLSLSLSRQIRPVVVAEFRDIPL